MHEKVWFFAPKIFGIFGKSKKSRISRGDLARFCGFFSLWAVLIDKKRVRFKERERAQKNIECM